MSDTLLAYPCVNIYCFEPNIEVFPALEQECQKMGKYNGKPRAKAFHMGLGSKEERRVFNICNHEKGSSFLDSTQACKDAWEGLDLGIKQSIETDICRVDLMLEREGIERLKLLKIDVEGFEFEVLRGAESKFSHIEYILAECQFTLINDGGKAWDEIVRYLFKHGFMSQFIADICQSPDGTFVIADVLFRNTRYMEQQQNRALFVR